MPEAQFFVRMRGKITGPFGIEGLRRLLRQGMLSRIHEISADRTTWAPAGEYEELFPAPVAAVEPDTKSDAFASGRNDYGMADRPAGSAAFPPASSHIASDAPVLPRGGTPYYAIPRRPLPPAVGKSHRGMALASLILALLGVSPLAIIFGAIALGGMKVDDNEDGKGMAIAGVVLGIIHVVAVVIIVIVVIVVASTSSGHK